ncbi:HNH endonuclease [Listeria innocua]|uniref:Putative HNH nuclease YajD n=2 Tax=Listeria innocua TaxID=1642 RepID=A0AB73HB81_LISIO|nr:HNH endonuclease [Listeria innocua]
MKMARERDDIDKLYKTGKWIALREVILKRDFYVCQSCKRRGVYSSGRVVHHVIEARNNINLFWNADNLEVVCDSCHAKIHSDKAKKKIKTKNSIVKFDATDEI